jgi:hypothetical protein
MVFLQNDTIDHGVIAGVAYKYGDRNLLGTAICVAPNKHRCLFQLRLLARYGL